MSTIFSKIIRGEIPSYKVYEDEYVYAFLDIKPMQPGHTLVVPRKEVDKLFDLDEDTYLELMKRARYVAKILQSKLNCARVCMLVEGYEIPHVHIKLVPTNTPHDIDPVNAKTATQEELLEMQTLLTQG